MWRKLVFGLSLLLCSLGLTTVRGDDCHARDYGHGSIVCVCNAEFCETVNPPEIVETGRYVTYTSNQAGLRFNMDGGTFIKSDEIVPNTIAVEEIRSYQEIFGWGGAFTDAAGININSLSPATKEKLLRSYFSEDGLEYSLCRVPIGGTDFSTHGYTYVDETKADEELSTFALTREDYELKIPLIHEAFKLTNNNLLLFASAWIAPKWMKVNGAYSGMLGFLKHSMYQPWANYHLKFLQSYANEDISFWGISTGNEPSLAFTPVAIPSVAWSSTQMSNWIVNNFGPTIRNSEFADIKILALDDQRILLPWYVDSLFKNYDTRKYIDGIGVHFYWNEFFLPSRLQQTHESYPEKFILSTEACVGDGFDVPVVLGEWSRGEKYMFNIIEDINYWSTGWIDWNMALDESGGPTYIYNNVDSPIIVNATADEFYKQPMYYAMGHFSKFVPRGSLRIYSSQFADDVPVTAFKRPDGGIVVVILNQRNEDIPAVLDDANRGQTNLHLTARSFTSVLYW